MREGKKAFWLVATILLILNINSVAAEDWGCCCYFGKTTNNADYPQGIQDYYLTETQCTTNPLWDEEEGEFITPIDLTGFPKSLYGDAHDYCYSLCTTQYCNGQTIDPGEECDGENFGGATCPDGSENLACTPVCTIDANNCGNQACAPNDCLSETTRCSQDGTYSFQDPTCGEQTEPEESELCEEQGHACCNPGEGLGISYENECPTGKECWDSCQTTDPDPDPEPGINCDVDGDLVLADGTMHTGERAQCRGTDCDDDNPEIYPDNNNPFCGCPATPVQGTSTGESPEYCGDGLNNNCDINGLIDEGCSSPCTPNIICIAEGQCVEGKQTETCIDENECTEPYTREINCQEAICGNGIVETGEQCDPTAPIDDPDQQCDPTNICVGAGQENECTCPIENICGDGICSANEQCESGTIICPEDCEGKVECGVCSEQPGPTITQIEDIILQPYLAIEWEFETCQDEINNFLVSRAIKDGETPTYPDDFEIRATLATNENNYEDLIEEGRTEYCYIIEAVYQDGTITPSEIVCDDSGDIQCLEPREPTNFCEGNTKHECLEDNEETENIDEDNYLAEPTICDQEFAGGTCVVNTEGNAECLVQAECEYCNGIYGMFSPYQILIEMIDPNNPDNPRQETCSENPTCYLEKTETTINKWEQCAQIESCYDYATPDACGQDTCGRVEGDCTWKPGGELSPGLCVPNDPEEQQCWRCGSELDQDCDTLEECAEYGECYYDGERNGGLAPKGCIKKSEFACRYYDTVTQCEMGLAPVEVDAQYPENERTNGTHKVNPSNDALGKGLCQWNNEAEDPYCFKNADNNVQEGARENYNDDCDETNTAGQTTCYTDTTPPETTMELPSLIGTTLEVRYTATDDKTGVKATYYCTQQEEESDCYPTTRIEGNIIENNCDGNCKIRYYSEDNARNLEYPIKEATYEADTEAPKITWIEPIMEPIQVGEDSYLTTLTTEFTATDEKPYTCNGMLVDTNNGQEIQPAKTIANIPGPYQREYLEVEDGVYEYYISCRDEAGNTNDQYWIDPRIIQVSADSSITNPTPFYQTYKEPEGIEMSVTTDRDADCRFALKRTETTTPEFSTMTSFTTGGTTHTYTITNNYWESLGLSLTEGRFAKFWVSCQFSPTETTEGNEADMIKFTVDPVGPLVSIVQTNNFEPYDVASIATEEHNFRLYCEDPTIKEYEEGPSHNYKCAPVRWIEQDCVETNCDPNDFNEEQNPVITITESTPLSYESFDLGGNTGTNGTINLLVDGEGPEFEIKITQSGEEVTNLYYGQYKVSVNVSELGSTLNSLTIDLQTGTDLELTEEANQIADDIWEAVLIINDQTFGIVNTEATIIAEGEDRAGNPGTGILEININTEAPPAPIFIPKFIDYKNLEYELYEHEGIYYTKNKEIYVSGEFEPKATIELYIAPDINSIVNPQTSFNQQGNSEREPENYKTITGAEAGTKILVIDLNYNSPEPTNWNYIKIPETRTNYEKYAHHYKVQSSRTTPVGLELTLQEELETAVSQGANIEKYNAKYPHNYFAATINIPETEKEYIILPIATNTPDGRNKVGTAYTFFHDNKPPSLQPKELLQGLTTNNNNPELIVEITDIALNPETINARLEQKTTTNTIEQLNERTWKLTATANSLEDGHYTLIVEAEDHAKNKVEETFTFTVAKDAPPLPIIRLKGEGTNSPSPQGIHYTNNAEGIIYLSYNLENVVVTNITNQNTGEEYPISCGNYPAISGNEIEEYFGELRFPPYTFMGCTVVPGLDEGAQKLAITSHKETFEGPGDSGKHTFDVVVDTTAPILNITAPSATRTGIDYEIKVEQLSEEEELVMVLTHNGQEITLNETTIGGETYFILKEYEWGVPENEERTETIQIKVTDYAGNGQTYTVEVVVDNILPTLTNILVQPNFVYDGEYIVVNLADVLFSGNNLEDTVTICSYDEQEQLIDSCVNKECIEEENCITETNFVIKNRLPFFVLEAESRSSINLEASDKVGNLYRETLLITADALAPEPISITISNKELGEEEEETTTTTGGGGGPKLDPEAT